MAQIKIVCGQWIFGKNKWLFGVDKGTRSKVISVDEKTSYDDFVQMVTKEYKVNDQIFDMELSYMFPKKVLLTLPQNTPPVDVKNQRQFTGFLEQLKTEAMQLCLELKKRVLEIDEDASDDEDEGSIFDYCDDLDGASSGDEDFALNEIHVEEEKEEEDEKNKNSTSMKSGSTSASVPVKRANDHVKLELDALNIAVGQRYDTKDALETRLKIFSVLHQFDFRVERSSKDILTIKCWIEGCTWRVRATPFGNSTQFTIHTHVSEHSCSITERSVSARQATPEILARLYVDYVGGVNSKVLPKHVGDALNMRFGVKMDYWKSHRTLLRARNIVRGSAESGYSELPMYLYHIRKANPGTFTCLEVDEVNRFKYLFLAFGASITGFPYMRKVIVVDGTYLQGKYKGTLLTATAQDGNFQIFPIAFAVVDGENDSSWEWFFQQLSKKRVPNAKMLTVQSLDLHHSQVTTGLSLHIVNLAGRQCTCRRFDKEKLPCVHAIVAAEARKQSSISLCHPYYHNSYLLNAYSTSIMPRDISSPVPENITTKICLPPVIHTQPGRPKRSRMKSALEKATEKKRPRKQHLCSNCHQSGHNYKTCKIQV